MGASAEMEDLVQLTQSRREGDVKDIVSRALSWMHHRPHGVSPLDQTSRQNAPSAILPQPRHPQMDDVPPLNEMERVLVVGAGSGGRIIAWELQSNPQWRLVPVAFVDDDPTTFGRELLGIPVLGDTDSIPAIVHSQDIDVVVIAIPSASSATHTRLVDIAQGTTARVLSMPAIGSILKGDSTVTTLKSVRPVDVLGRSVVKPDRDSCLQFIRGQKVLITGAAGSIGAELSMQVAELDPAHLLLLDINETGLHDLVLDIRRQYPRANVEFVITSVTDNRRVKNVFARYRPGIVLHAAAYKHVPAMELQPEQALETNVIGTDNVVRQAAAHGADRFVLVSTDKAVRPSSVMGASKRLAELVTAVVGYETGLSVCSVRFGNVLGSRGSVIPIFERQIRSGGPVTVTDARMKRYFMTIPEAVSLIIQAGAFGHRNATYILDMGEEVSILDLARRVIRLHGLREGMDIEITFTGVRPGEKLYEELTLDFESAQETDHPKIRRISGLASGLDVNELPPRLSGLMAEIDANPARVRDRMFELVREIDAVNDVYQSSTVPGAEPERVSASIGPNVESRVIDRGADA
jgi:FlaA1/EpsC-like NDP-sugar epimerase